EGRYCPFLFCDLSLRINPICRIIPSTMEMVDPERERQRLREEYSRMIDGELEQIAANEVDLTDVASAVLREEMSRRGLSRESATQVPETHLPMAGDLLGRGESLRV